MQKIEFRISRIDLPVEYDSREIRVFVDDEDYIKMVDLSQPTLLREATTNVGLHPVNFYKQSALLSGGILDYARCCCGDFGCGHSSVKVIIKNGVVSWRSTGKPDVDFEQIQYENALETIVADSSWERPNDVLQRMAKEFDYSKFETTGLNFEFVYLDHENILKIYFRNPEDRQLSSVIPYVHGDSTTPLQCIANWLEYATPNDSLPNRSMAEVNRLKKEAEREKQKSDE